MNTVEVYKLLYKRQVKYSE
ncbi:hypothetical protein CAEBREN_07211 [Caenorhabditis brenneri]|uniref:Uncharacterized protein n=1 Tax=Caenorhabditis brenneri TaxID=135651 RepID=G0MB49_CAEBE|nr:hypothetical protein CAEBREN_07211 [Caenorhabditis brenneri]